MSNVMLGDYCNEQFFNQLASQFDSESTVGNFIADNAQHLAYHMKAFFKTLPIIFEYGEYEAPILVYSRFSTSLERIAIALTRQYNPLHNVDVTETETNSGTDSHTYGGTDTTTLTRSSQGIHYEQLKNESLTSGSTFDDTDESNMKPISKTEHDFETQQNTNSSGLADVEYGKTLDMEYGRQIDKTKQGNIGVMPTQNLLQLEYNTRFRMTLFDAVVRAVVTTLSCGVWED